MHTNIFLKCGAPFVEGFILPRVIQVLQPRNDSIIKKANSGIAKLTKIQCCLAAAPLPQKKTDYELNHESQTTNYELQKNSPWTCLFSSQLYLSSHVFKMLNEHQVLVTSGTECQTTMRRLNHFIERSQRSKTGPFIKCELSLNVSSPRTLKLVEKKVLLLKLRLRGDHEIIGFL